MNMICLKGGRILDVAGKRIFEGDVIIEKGLIREVREPGQDLPGGAEIIDVSGAYIAPGFIDAHIHIESSMLPPLEFSRAAVPCGTTAVVVDPHEITNVFGTRAIDLFLQQADIVPMDMYVGIPSCVPATSLEHSGAEITVDDVLHYMGDKRVYGLAEMMNFPGIIYGDASARAKVDAVFDAGKLVDGHCPGLRGDDLLAYVSNGRKDGVVRIMNDHETTEVDEAMEKLGAGMHLAIRYGSAEKNLNTLLPGLIKEKADLSRCMLCSDDVSVAELSRDGHVDRIIRRARDIFMETAGLDSEAAAIEALAMATINPSRFLEPFYDYHQVPHTGEVAAGFKANLVVLSSLEDLRADRVIRNGVVVAENGRLCSDPGPFDYSGFLKSVNVGKKIEASDFRIEVPGGRDEVMVNVIEAVPHSLITRKAVVSFAVRAGQLSAQPEKDLAKIAVFERHHGTGSRQVAFVRGLGITKNAIASTVAHDSHNLIVAGVDDTAMARAANYLIEHGGGMVVVRDDDVVYFPLQIGGLMSTMDRERVVEQYKSVVAASKMLGMKRENIFMTLSFISLPVIPELKITDRGLVDVEAFDFIGLLA